MRYVKTYESFRTENLEDLQKIINFNNSLNLNESLLDDIIDFFKNIWDYLKEKASDVVEFLGDKWNEFKDKVSELANKIVELIGDKLGEVMKNIESVFGKPAQDLSFEDIKRGLQNMSQVQELTKTNEEFDYHKKSGMEDMADPSISKDDPLMQKILGIFQFIFKVNMFACFAPLAFVFAYFFGFYTGMIPSIIVTYIGVAIFGVIRTLLYRSTEKTKEKIKDSNFLRKKEELIDYLTGTDVDYKLGCQMSKKEPGYADIDQDGEFDTEMMTFKKGDILIFAGVNFYSSGDIKYVTTVRKLSSGETLLEAFITKDIEELNYILKDVVNGNEVDDSKKIHYKTYGDGKTLDRVMASAKKGYN